MSAAPDKDWPVNIGDHIGHWVVTQYIAKGGMGAFVKARHPQIGASVAIKLMLPKYGAKKEFVARFFQEIQTLLALRHPRVVYVQDGGARAPNMLKRL